MTGVTKDYYVFFNPGVTGVADALGALAFDIISFDFNDDTNSWITLDSVQIDEVTLTP